MYTPKGQLITEYKATIMKIIETDTSLTNFEKNCLVDSIGYIGPIADGDYISQYFDYIDKGAYKACFNLSPSYIIKFTVEDSTLNKECRLYQAAVESPVEPLFIETHYISSEVPLRDPITDNMDIDNYDDWNSNSWTDSWSDNWNAAPAQHFDTIIIQKKLDTIEKDYSEENEDIESIQYGDNYEEATQRILDTIQAQTSYSITVDDLKDCGFTTLPIIISVLKTYGIDFWKEMIKFFKANAIYDLHSGNCGYLDDKPVIIDWLSN